jgi:hypothetical protein
MFAQGFRKPKKSELLIFTCFFQVCNSAIIHAQSSVSCITIPELVNLLVFVFMPTNNNDKFNTQFTGSSDEDERKVFMIRTDVTVEADAQKELFVPCPISDPKANVSVTYVRTFVFKFNRSTN